MAEHDELDKLEHELHKVEFNRPYDIMEIRKLKGKIQDLKNKNQESYFVICGFLWLRMAC